MIQDYEADIPNEELFTVDENHCVYCKAKSNLVECGICEYKFCNGLTPEIQLAHILFHLKQSEHHCIKIASKKNTPYNFKEIKCRKCTINNIYDLFFVENEKDDITKKIYCKEHLPKNCENKKNIVENLTKIINDIVESPNVKNEPNYDSVKLCTKNDVYKIEEMLEGINPIATRFLNKIQLKYSNKYDYYKIQKPLLIADMLYEKSLYQKNLEYDIELKVNIKHNSRIYYFEIDIDFFDITFMVGKTLHFTEISNENLYNENEEENVEIKFIGVITDIQQKKRKNSEKNEYHYNEITIIPLNKHISYLENHEGYYKIKEEFCYIPYERMIDALEQFVNDDIDEEEIYDRAVSSYLTKRILGKKIDNEENKKIEKKALKHLFKNYKELKPITKIENIGELNESQTKVIENVFSNVLNMIQGPPGTGKTFLASFIAYNLFKFKKHYEDKILLAAPSNAAADNLTSAILKINKVTGNKIKILRVLAKNREFLELEPDVLHVSLHTKLNEMNENNEYVDENEDEIYDEYENYKEEIYDEYENYKEEIFDEYENYKEEIYDEYENYEDNYENEIFDECENHKDEIFDECENHKEKIKQQIDYIMNDIDIVITTCSSSLDDRIKNYSFKYVLIDENTQCREIESLIPIIHGCCHLTLIGDQKQLGPVILHPKAKKTGMNISLMERMIKLYPKNHYLLTKQYRMHEKIVEFPSKTFYENKIENGVSIKERTNKIFNNNFNWFNKNIPLLFIHVEGEEKTCDGKSRLNEKEAEIVCYIIEKIIKNCKIKTKNIGIITPYTAQKNLIIRKMQNYSDDIFNISSVDGFQGKEKDYIILSSVRSNLMNNIGFLKDFRRLNVSITRAKYGMIIIGNAKCLVKGDDVWKKLIRYYQKNNLLTMFDLKEGEELNINKLKGIKILSEKEGEINFSDEFDYDCSGNKEGINKDLLNNFDLSQNIYVETNKKYYGSKKSRKQNKNGARK